MPSILIPRRVTFTQPAPDRLVIAEGGGWMAAFGAAFLLPGLVLMVIGLHLLPMIKETFTINGIPVLALFGLPFVLVGGWGVFGRRWLTLDRGRRRLVIERGLLVPMVRRERDLGEFTAVTLYYQVGGEDSAECYPVILTAGNRGKDLSINDLKTYGQAYAQAAQLALFLQLSLQDTTTDHPLTLAPEEVEHPLQARLHAEARQPQSITPPATLRSQVEESAQGVRLTVPGQITGRLVFVVALLAAFPIIIIVPIFLKHVAQAGPTETAFFTGVAALIVCFPLFSLAAAALRARRTCTVVTVDGQGIILEEYRGRTNRGMVMIPTSDLVDVDYDRSGILLESKGVSLKAKSGLYTFGAGLPDAEVRYLAQVVRRALS